MATGTPQITPFSWHMAQPSAIETSLAAKVDDPSNPSAIPMLAYYQAQNHINNDNYTAGLADTNAEQVRQAQQLRDNELRKTLISSLKDFGTTPGAVAAARSAGLLPSEMDTGQLEQAAVDHAGAANIGAYGRGAGALMMAGANGMDTSLQRFVGPGVTQGPSALEKAAAIKSAGHGGGRGSDKTQPGEVVLKTTYMEPGGRQVTETDRHHRPGSSAGAAPAPSASQMTSAMRADVAKGVTQGNVPRTNPSGGVIYTGASGRQYPVDH